MNLTKAAYQYNLESRDWNLVKSYANHIYVCEDKVMQLTPSSYKSANELLLETELLNYLNESKISVVQVVKSNNGNSVEPFANYNAICYDKIIGRKATTENWNESFFHQLGAYTGRLHKLCKSYEKENNPNFKNWNEIPKARIDDFLPDDERKLKELHHNLLELFLSYPINSHNYGPVHYDIHHGNYFLTGPQDKIVLFDFEMTCKSWYINDVSIILYYILNAVQLEDYVEITTLFERYFFEGYRSENEIDEVEKQKIPFFILYRDLLVYAFTFRMWPTLEEMDENELKFRNKLSSAIERRRKIMRT